MWNINLIFSKIRTRIKYLKQWGKHITFCFSISMALPLEETDRLKRKLRKKLRQIENLEIIDRELNNEELDKVSKKGEIRAELAALISQCEANSTEEEMKRKTNSNPQF